MIKLRGHHLICLNFFSGEGFSDEFINNLKYIRKRLNEGETINTGHRADDICNMCEYLKNGKCLYNENADIEIQNMDKTAIALLKIEHATNLEWKKINSGLSSIFDNWYKWYCIYCEWLKICRKNEEFLKLLSTL